MRRVNVDSRVSDFYVGWLNGVRWVYCWVEELGEYFPARPLAG